jgi:glutathione S-transferase
MGVPRLAGHLIVECDASVNEIPEPEEGDLADRSWLAGDAFTQADAAALPYVLRLDHLSMTPLVEARPRVADWYARVQARKSFEVAITSILPAFIIDVFRSNGAAVWDEVRALSSLA